MNRIMRQFDDGMAGAQVSSFVPEQVMRTAYNPFIVDLMPNASSLKGRHFTPSFFLKIVQTCNIYK